MTAQRWRTVIIGALMVALASGCSGERSSPGPVPTRLNRPQEQPPGPVLVRDRQLIVRDMGNGIERTLRTAPNGSAYAYPRWSPDGTQLAYVITSYPTGANGQDWGSDVAVSQPDGGNERVVAPHGQPGTNVFGIAWSADSTALYLSTLAPSPSRLKLERLDLTTGRRTTIAMDAAYPASAADGSRIAFLTYSNDSEPGGLWTARSDGADGRRLITVGSALELAGIRSPQFSPDGQRIAFGAVTPAAANLSPPPCGSGRHWPWQPRVAEAHGPPFDLWIVATDGGTPQKIADLGADDPWLAWSPDGEDIAVIEPCRLALVRPAQGTTRNVGEGAAQAQLDWR